MSLDNALVCAYIFDGSGGVEEVEAAAVDRDLEGPRWHWVHLDRTCPEVEPWLQETADLDPLVVEALLERETRPRSVAVGDGLLVILRGVNLNAGADPEDMISMRLWADPHRLVSLRARRLMAVQDLRERFARGEIPKTPGALLVDIAGALIDRMAPVLDELNDEVDQLEEVVLDSPGHELRSQLSRLRRRAIGLRRFLAPQREVLARLQIERTSIFSDLDRNHIREITDRLTRYIEELDAARDRGAVTQEELVGRISDQMNRNMYVLSIITGIFLPLGLLTGLFGINVGGMPGVESKWGFTIVCAILIVLAFVALWLLRRFRML